MSLEDRLKYCKLCQNRVFDIQKGLLCKLTYAKPVFEKSCNDYHEDLAERKNLEVNQFYDTPQNGSLLDTNAYSTSKTLIKIAQIYLPDHFQVLRINYFQLFSPSLFSFLLLLLTINFATEPITLGASIVIILALGIYLTIRVGKQTFVESTTIATFTNQEIILKDDKVIAWDDVTLAYIQTNGGLTKKQGLYLTLNLLSQPNPLRIRINQSYGSTIILTIAEAYRKKEEL